MSINCFSGWPTSNLPLLPQQPCPNCGYCPTCGQRKQPQWWGPYWITQPNTTGSPPLEPTGGTIWGCDNG